MPRKRMLAMVFGTAMCALGLGYFVQYGESTPAPEAVPAAAPIQQSVLKPSAAPVEESGALELRNMAHTSAMRDPAPQLPRPARVDLSLATAPGGARVLPDRPADLSLATAPGGARVLPDRPADPARANACDVSLSAQTAALATVDLEVSAPCLPNERVTIHHGGMMFTDATDADGRLAVNVPALSENAVFIVQFGNGNGNVVVAQVPELDQFDRVVLQWTGNTGFQLHALEFGAAYGEAGHVWSGADTAGRGVVTRLGNAQTLAPQMAEIYSFPSGAAENGGTVALSIEAEVTAGNCGRDIDAQTLELRGDGTLRPRELTLAVPDCGAVGDFLVLNNLVEDLTIAAR